MKGFRRLPLLTALSCAGLIGAIAASSAAAEQPPRLTAHSLHALLEQAVEAFGNHDFVVATDRFQQLERDFGAEAEYREALFLRRVLPLKGHAELMAGFPAAAALTLARFVDGFPGDPQHAAALSGLATALQQEGRLEEAAERLVQFQALHGTRPEAPLAVLQRAEILFALERPAEALDLLEKLLAGTSPAVFRTQARLRAGRRLLESGELSAAAQLLLDHRWEIDRMPEIGALCFAALELGDRLLEEERADEAIRAYRLVLPRARLLELQENRTAEIRAALQRMGAGSGGFWSAYYTRMLEELERQAAALQQSEDYTPALLLRRGQAMLVAGRHHEAWLLFERLALEDALAGTVREEAHYRWILAASGLELWEEALTIARTFLRRYPDAPLAPQALYLIAQAHQEQRRYAEAAALLDDLQERFPDHPLAQRWRFTQGFNQAVLEDYGAARSHFRRAVEDYPPSQLTANAELWHALTYFFERDYAAALDEFEQLAIRYNRHPLAGEILYRRASTLYAMRNYERAGEAAADFVERFQAHQRHGEALVLLGDIRMGAGELERALEDFAAIQPEAGHLYLYGLFQRGKILRARQDYEGMIALFEGYLERTDLEPKHRLSEALYWIGWAQAQLERPEKAVPVFLTALERHGDDPEAAEIGTLLGQLERLYPWPGSTHPDFASWLAEERRRSLAAGRLTAFSRLTLRLAEIRRRQNLPYQAESLLFEIAALPLETLGPDALGPVGHLLAEKRLETAGGFFRALRRDHPSAPERAFAFHGIGLRHFEAEEYLEALSWLRRFAHETPTHPLAADVLQKIGETLLRLNRLAEAEAAFEEILRLRSLRGRPHARALIGLAETMEAAGRPDRAVPYYQRVYTLHRAQADLTAHAYFESSRLFEDLGDSEAAHRTLTEMLSLTELTEFPGYEKGAERIRNLAPTTEAPREPQQDHADVE